MRLRGAAFEVPSRFDRVPTHRFFAWSTTLKVAFIKGVGETSNHYVLTQSLKFLFGLASVCCIGYMRVFVL